MLFVFGGSLGACALKTLAGLINVRLHVVILRVCDAVFACGIRVIFQIAMLIKMTICDQMWWLGMTWNLSDRVEIPMYVCTIDDMANARSQNLLGVLA